MNCGIGIFVKTPSLSPVKTRLWPGLGRQCSEALYLISAEAVASVAESAQRHGGLQPYWAVAEAAALHSDAWIDLPHLSQGSGSLGARMAHVYRMLRMRHHSAILIGADTPQLVPDALQRAAEWLSSDEPRLAIGRAQDGGFWLFGGNQPLPLEAWLSPRYSTSEAAGQLVASMDGNGRWLELETLRDIDTAMDLPDVHERLSQLNAPTEAQQRLVDWLNGLPSAMEGCR
ncbi:MAG: DUF2064 domain-containing protein [Lysobacter sp.]|nr:DUF2064 domain-containing protein [Lysobacter sp.]MDQ3269599.1 DUF2064 domain-containing protein [Pseudomonadota bacterium]